ncbi:uncharacterized protein LOC143898604 [Temnothorax americanus]|uniref:uncharacterized protein LOC143898604 n=1 Tax=Temnothorax americanus TaxID=1964332 RepID=UPI004068AFE9
MLMPRNRAIRHQECEKSERKRSSRRLVSIGRRSNYTGSKRGPSSRSGLHANARALMVAIRTYQLDRNSRDKLPRLQSRASRITEYVVDA